MLSKHLHGETTCTERDIENWPEKYANTRFVCNLFACMLASMYQCAKVCLRNEQTDCFYLELMHELAQLRVVLHLEGHDDACACVNVCVSVLWTCSYNLHKHTRNTEMAHITHNT